MKAKDIIPLLVPKNYFGENYHAIPENEIWVYGDVTLDSTVIDNEKQILQLGDANQEFDFKFDEEIDLDRYVKTPWPIVNES
jgi:hypothetical protein